MSEHASRSAVDDVVFPVPLPQEVAEPQFDFFDDFSFLLLQFLVQEHSIACTGGSTFPSPGDSCNGAYMSQGLPQPLESLRRTLLAARPPQTHSQHMDLTVELATYVIRLKRLLEHQVHRQQAQTLLRFSPVEFDSLSSELIRSMRAPSEALDAAVAGAAHNTQPVISCDGGGVTEGKEMVKLCSGRRFCVPVSPRSKGNGSPPAEAPRESNQKPVVPDENYHSTTPSPVIAMKALPQARCSLLEYHARITLRVQKYFYQWLGILDDPASQHSFAALDGSALKLQRAFVDGLATVLTKAAIPTTAASDVDGTAQAFNEEISVVVSRLSTALLSTRSAIGAARIIVFEVDPLSTQTVQGIPFCSTCCDSPLPYNDAGATTASDRFARYSSSSCCRSAYQSEIDAALGKPGASYVAMLVAQQAWCCQRVLQQRFPLHRVWECLERVLLLLETSCSPSPNVPSEARTRNSGDPEPSATALVSPGEASVHELCSGRKSEKGSEVETPLRPPPAIEHTQEKPSRISKPSIGTVRAGELQPEKLIFEEPGRHHTGASDSAFGTSARTTYFSTPQTTREIVEQLRREITSSEVLNNFRSNSFGGSVGARGRSFPLFSRTVNTANSPKPQSVPTFSPSRETAAGCLPTLDVTIT